MVTNAVTNAVTGAVCNRYDGLWVGPNSDNGGGAQVQLQRDPVYSRECLRACKCLRESFIWAFLTLPPLLLWIVIIWLLFVLITIAGNRDRGCVQKCSGSGVGEPWNWGKDHQATWSSSSCRPCQVLLLPWSWWQENCEFLKKKKPWFHIYMISHFFLSWNSNKFDLYFYFLGFGG